MEIKKKTGILIVIIIILIAAIPISFLLGKKLSNKDKEDTRVEKKVKVSEDDPLTLYTDYFVIYDSCFDAGFSYRFDETSRKIEEFTDKEKLNLLLAIIENDTFDSEDYSVEYKKEDFKKYFDDLSFLDTIEDGGSYTHNGFSLEYESGKYKTDIKAFGCEEEEIDFAEPGLIFYEAEKTNKKLYITYAYGFAVYELIDTFAVEDEYEIRIYRHENDKKPVYTVTDNDISGLDFSSFDKYQFVIDISNGNYKVEEIKFIKGDE